MSATRMRRVTTALLVVTSVSVVLSSCADLPGFLNPAARFETLDQQVRFPAEFSADTYYPLLPSGSDWTTLRIEFEDVDTATLTDYPVGEVEVEDTGLVCLDWKGDMHTGEGTWKADDKGHIRITTDDGRASLFSAGVERFGTDLDWRSSGLVLCGEEAVLNLVTGADAPFD
ncbi:hypothetical protein [Microbacterium sp. P02]|uniref:hypothetical protein n=1 Tax=Microbacterium sp. P02 TaxID=3366260 RepID=UPI00366F3A63